MPFDLLKLKRSDGHTYLIRPHYCKTFPKEHFSFAVMPSGNIYVAAAIPQGTEIKPASTQCPSRIKIKATEMDAARKLRRMLYSGLLLWVLDDPQAGLMFIFARHQKHQDVKKLISEPYKRGQRGTYEARYFELEPIKDCREKLVRMDQYVVHKNEISKLLLPSEFNSRHKMETLDKLKLTDSMNSVTMVNEINDYIRNGACVKFYSCFRKDDPTSILHIEVLQKEKTPIK